MGQDDIIVHPFLAVGHAQTAQVADGLFAVERDADPVAELAAVEREKHQVERRAGGQADVEIRFLLHVVRLVLENQVFRHGAFAERKCRAAVRPEISLDRAFRADGEDPASRFHG